MLMKVKFIDIESEFVEFETGTCELCFGSDSGDEETFVFEVTTEDGTTTTEKVDNYYYTPWDGFLETYTYIDNFPRFAEWLLTKTFDDDTVLNEDWLQAVGEDFNVYDKLFDINMKFEELSRVSGNAQEALLEKQLRGYSYTYREVLLFLLDPNKTSGISKKKIQKELDLSDAHIYAEEGIVDIIDYILENNTGSDEVIKHVQRFMEREPKFKELVSGIITKGIKLGVSKTTYNKVAKRIDPHFKLIPEFNPQLAYNIDSVMDKIDKDDNFLGNVFVTEKLDGIRAVIAYRDFKYKVYSRSGKVIEGLDHIINELTYNNKAWLNKGNYVIDGELTLPEQEGVRAEDEFRETTKVVNSNKDKSDVIFNAFDVVDFGAFFLGEKSKPYHARRTLLDSRMKESEHINIVPVLGETDSFKEVQKIYDESVSHGSEGVMLNSATGAYETKRTRNIYKMKQYNTVDLRVISLEEGSGRLSDTTGALVVNYKGNELRVGTGLSDDDRTNFWNNKEDIVGKIIEIGYTTESQDKDGNYSLRFPRFIGVRKDKESESYE